MTGAPRASSPAHFKPPPRAAGHHHRDTVLDLSRPSSSEPTNHQARLDDADDDDQLDGWVWGG
eukprot:120875-Rhodomonas_salina.2